MDQHIDQTIDQIIDQAIRPVADTISAFIFYAVPLLDAQLPLIVVWLVAGGCFFTLYLRFVNLRGFAHAIALVRGRYARDGDPGEISQFQALTAAVSGTVGLGNIAGVAVAISLGGPGATFWMIVAGLLGMSTKFAECTLGVLYRRQDDPSAGRPGHVAGGPMYYLTRGLAELNWPRTGRALGIFYAAAMVIGCLGIGNMFQSNQATALLIDASGGADSWLAGRQWLVGVTLAAAVGLVIIGGIRSIARTTARLVPAMALLYVVSAGAVIVMHADRLPRGVSGHLAGRVRAGGHRRRRHRRHDHGFSPRRVLQRSRTRLVVHRPCHRAHPGTGERGLRRAARAVHRHRGDLHPDRAGDHHHGLRAVPASGRARGCQRYRADQRRLCQHPVLGAAAAVGGSHPVCVLHHHHLVLLRPEGIHLPGGRPSGGGPGFKLFFLSFVVLGSSVQLGALVDLSDALVFVVAIPNLLGLYLLAPRVRRELQSYEARIRRPG
jgi:alanine or glycine:cation symporter, AGCS family